MIHFIFDKHEKILQTVVACTLMICSFSFFESNFSEELFTNQIAYSWIHCDFSIFFLIIAIANKTRFTKKYQICNQINQIKSNYNSIKSARFARFHINTVRNSPLNIGRKEKIVRMLVRRRTAKLKMQKTSARATLIHIHYANANRTFCDCTHFAKHSYFMRIIDSSTNVSETRAETTVSTILIRWWKELGQITIFKLLNI